MEDYSIYEEYQLTGNVTLEQYQCENCPEEDSISTFQEMFGNNGTQNVTFYPCDNYLEEVEATNSTLDVQTFLELCMAVKRHPYEILIPLTVIHCIMFITGISGNATVCYIIVRNPGMHTSTNFFLFSLAVADIAILFVGLPNDLYVYWQQYPWIFGEKMCKTRALVSEMTSYSSVLTIVAFSMERYLAICHPLYSYTMSGLRRASKIIAVVWALALAAAIPYMVFTKVHYVNHPHTNQTIPESAFCTITPTPRFLFESSFLFFFLIPMTIMIFLYVRMGLRIRKTATFGKNTAVHGESKQAQSKKAILKMLAAVVLAFFICWAPFHAQRLLYVIYYDYSWKFATEDVYQQINEKLFYITGCFYYFSSTVNPILYNVLSVKYRNAFKETLCGKRPETALLAGGERGGRMIGQYSLAASVYENGGQLGGSRGRLLASKNSTRHLSLIPTNGHAINGNKLPLMPTDHATASKLFNRAKTIETNLSAVNLEDEEEVVEFCRRDVEMVEMHANVGGSHDILRITTKSPKKQLTQDSSQLNEDETKVREVKAPQVCSGSTKPSNTDGTTAAINNIPLKRLDNSNLS